MKTSINLVSRQNLNPPCHDDLYSSHRLHLKCCQNARRKPRVLIVLKQMLVANSCLSYCGMTDIHKQSFIQMRKEKAFKQA